MLNRVPNVLHSLLTNTPIIRDNKIIIRQNISKLIKVAINVQISTLIDNTISIIVLITSRKAIPTKILQTIRAINMLIIPFSTTRTFSTFLFLTIFTANIVLTIFNKDRWTWR